MRFKGKNENDISRSKFRSRKRFHMADYINFKNRFVSKVVLMIVIVILIPTIFISTLLYYSAKSMVKDNVRESSLQIARQAADSLSFAFSNGSDMSDYIYSNEQIQEMVEQDSKQELSEFDKENNNEYIYTFLNSNIYSSSFVRIIYVLKDEGSSWGSGTFSPYKLSKVKLNKLDWVKESIKNDGEVVWQGLQYDSFSGAGENTDLVITINRVMKDFDTLDNIAYIQVSLDGRAILERINQVKLGKTGFFFVVDSEARVMIDNNLKKINKKVPNKELYHHILSDANEFEFTENDMNYYGVKQSIGNGWSTIGIVPVNEITGELANVQRLTILTSVLFGIVSIGIGILFARRVTDPIKVLTNQMKLVGNGDFAVRTKVNSNDEIGEMSQQFNFMINRMENLLEQIKAEQDQKQEAELRAIKHRINPHFLFNTLSTIRWLVKFKQTERANTALSALSKLLEANMGKKGTFITIKEELDFIEKFMVILQIRYEQNFDLIVDVNKDVEDFLIPRMVLQPLVENAVFHGIVPTGREGTVEINVSKISQGVDITVRDNGEGIDQAVLENIQQTPSQEDTSIGIGLRHVFDSLRLYYHPSSKMEIVSSQDGTVVKLILISKKRGEDNV